VHGAARTQGAAAEKFRPSGHPGAVARAKAAILAPVIYLPEHHSRMLEITEDIPFLWRLSTDNGEGFSMVSMVIPFNSGSENLEHTIPTDVVSFTGDNEALAEEEVLEWNEEDIALFLKLLSTRETGGGFVRKGDSSQTYRIDLSDPETIEIVHIVAAAGFGMALVVDDLLVNDPAELVSTPIEPDVGTRITLHTVDGYKRGVVVGTEDDEVVCVLQDPIRIDNQIEATDIHTHDLVVVKAHQLLPARYSSSHPTTGDVLH
jgi:hypothetical protein